MKKKYTLLLTILLSQTAPVMAMDLEDVEHHRIPHQAMPQVREGIPIREGLAVNFALNGEANLLIRTLARNLNDEICQITSEGITNHVNQMIRNNRDLVGALRLNLRRFFGELNSLSDAVNTNPMVLANFLEQNFLDAQVRTKIDDIIFLQNICPEITCRTQDWRQAINGTLTPLFDYGIDPVSQFEGETLTLTGSLLGSSDIETNLDGRAVTNISVQAGHKIFIDQDIRMPGVNLTLNTTYLKVIGDRKIDLSGSDAADFNPPKAENGIQISNNNPDEFHRRNGQDGAAGHPGRNGGNFRGVWTAPDGLEKLTINTSGGKGGKGQEGGDGADGRKGDDGETAVRNRYKSALIDSKEVGYYSILEAGAKFLLTFNGKFRETYESRGTPGEERGAAGNGGSRGDGGNAGMLLINNNPPVPNQLTFYNNPGVNGDLGDAGRSGQRGIDGKPYRGIYISEYVAPSLQGIREVDSSSVANGVIGGAQGAGTGAVASFAARPVYEVSKEFLKNSWRALGRIGGKEVYEVSKEFLKGGKAVAQAAGSYTGMVASMGLGVLVQAGCSGISAYLSSGWEIEPHEIGQENSQPEEQPNN